VRSPLPEYDDCTFLCAVWDKETLAKDYNMKIMAEPVVHESADKDLLAGRALQLLTVLQSVFAHIRNSQRRLLWRDKFSLVRTWLTMESITVTNVRKGCGLPVVAEPVCISVVCHVNSVGKCILVKALRPVRINVQGCHQSQG